MGKSTKYSKKYFEQFRTTPIEFQPFDPITIAIATEYVVIISTLTKGIQVEVVHRGSTLFQILGKNDVDIAVYAENIRAYKLAKEALRKNFGTEKASGKDFAAFYDCKDGFEVEISLMKGQEAANDKGLTSKILEHQDLIQQYETLKREFSFSKREYLWQRSRFFARIMETFES